MKVSVAPGGIVTDSASRVKPLSIGELLIIDVTSVAAITVRLMLE